MPPSKTAERALRLHGGGKRRAGQLGDELNEAIDITGDVNWPRPVPVRPDTFEISSVGSDPTLQLVGSDPSGGQSWSGLVVPTDPTPSFDRRYLFLLAWMRLDANRRGKIRGIRTSLRLGVSVNAVVGSVASPQLYPIEHEIVDPFWKAPLGNAVFYLRRITPGQRLVFNADDGPSLNFDYANTPSLLYHSLAPYVPPGTGAPPGVDLMPSGSWYDLRYGPVRDSSALYSTDIAVQGRCDIGLFCSLQQMPAVKAVPAPGVTGLGPDDAFLQANPTAQYARVFGSFIWQEVSAR